MIDEKEVRKVAVLSRIYLTDSEEKDAEKYLQQVITYVDKLNELDTSTVSPTFADSIPFESLREDRVIPSMSNEALMSNAPEHEDGAYVVPVVVE